MLLVLLAIFLAIECKLHSFHQGLTCVVDSDCTIIGGSDGEYLPCIDGVCSACEVGENQCNVHLMTCQVKKVESDAEPFGVCARKGFWPLNIWEIAATVIGVFGGCFASAAGIGGGGIYLPVYMLLAGYTTKVAAPLSTITIFGSAISNVGLLLFDRHPNPKINKPRIDYNLALILEPIILAGTTVGVLCNVFFPKWLTLIFLVVTLSISSWRTTSKGLKQMKDFREKNKAVEEDDETVESTDGESTELQDTESSVQESSGEEENEGGSSVDDDSESKESESEDIESTEEETSDVPVEEEKCKLLLNYKWYESLLIQPIQSVLLVFVWVFVFIVTLLKGSKKTPSVIGIEACGDTYLWFWLINAVSIPVLVVFSLLVGVVFYCIHKKRINPKNEGTYDYIDEETRWGVKNSFVYPLLFFFAGIAAGLLGIGGGMVIAPLFIEIGVRSEVGSSTSALMILFTSSATVVQYFILGALDWKYSLYFGICGFISSFIGRMGIGYIIKKLKSGFVITLIIGATIAGATILLGTVGIKELIYDYLAARQSGNWGKFSFKGMC